MAIIWLPNDLESRPFLTFSEKWATDGNCLCEAVMNWLSCSLYFEDVVYREIWLGNHVLFSRLQEPVTRWQYPFLLMPVYVSGGRPFVIDKFQSYYFFIPLA